jgi:hypothetical protein
MLSHEDPDDEFDMHSFRASDPNFLAGLVVHIRCDIIDGSTYVLGVVDNWRHDCSPTTTGPNRSVLHPDGTMSFHDLRAEIFYVYDLISESWILWDVANPVMENLGRGFAGYLLATTSCDDPGPLPPCHDPMVDDPPDPPSPPSVSARPPPPKRLRLSGPGAHSCPTPFSPQQPYVIHCWVADTICYINPTLAVPDGFTLVLDLFLTGEKAAQLLPYTKRKCVRQRTCTAFLEALSSLGQTLYAESSPCVRHMFDSGCPGVKGMPFAPAREILSSFVTSISIARQCEARKSRGSQAYADGWNDRNGSSDDGEAMSCEYDYEGDFA